MPVIPHPSKYFDIDSISRAITIVIFSIPFIAIIINLNPILRYATGIYGMIAIIILVYKVTKVGQNG